MNRITHTNPNRILKETLDQNLAIARRNFEHFGNLTSVLFLNEGGQITIHGLLWRSREDKDAVSEMIQSKVEAGIVSEYILISECWTLEFNMETTKPAEAMRQYHEYIQQHGSIQNHPLAKELVNCLYASPEEEIVHSAKIDSDTRKLGEWNKMETKFPNDPIGWKTRFASMFRNAAARNN